MTDPHANWPYLRLKLYEEPDDEQAATLAAMAAEAGSTGSVCEKDALMFYFETTPDLEAMVMLRERLIDLARELGCEPTGAEEGDIPDEPWATAWKEDFKDTPVGNLLLVRPDWLAGEPLPADCEMRIPVILRPGQGFGTGRHETTRLALEILEAQLRPGDRLLDFGTGSAILAIAALRLEADEVIGVDCDPAAIDNALENLELNGMTGKIELICNEAPEVVEGEFDLVVCNMLPQYALPLMAALAKKVSPSGRMIYSGFLGTQRDEIDEALAGAGLHVNRWLSMGEWGAAICTLA